MRNGNGSGARFGSLLVLLTLAQWAAAGVGDPQLKTDDPWYPGELSCSTFPRLFATEAELYARVTGRPVKSDEDRALAAWYWRNLHYWHGEEGQRDCFAAEGGQAKFGGDKGREYWAGLFADGFALCGTTHAQWCGEIEALLGHCRCRVSGVAGHNSFEVYLTGGPYGAGRWALLDHDISTVIYDRQGQRLLGLAEVIPEVGELANPAFDPARQHGWRVSGLHDDDARGVYKELNAAEYLAGYAGAPPIVHLRSGETLRRYLQPGLADGHTFVFWGRDYAADSSAGVHGPERDRTWVNQPAAMYGAKRNTGAREGAARYANAVYTYAPDFAGGGYRQGVIDDAADHVTFEFYTPYVIAATPPAHSGGWGIYQPGCTNGLVLHLGAATSSPACTVDVSTDQGRTWQGKSPLRDGLDLTDAVKGCRQHLLRFSGGGSNVAAALAKARPSWTTVCQANASTMPHLHGGQNAITFAADGLALVSAGPLESQAAAHVVGGALGSPNVTLELAAPRGAMPVHVYAAAWQSSGNPPGPQKYAIDYSTDGGRTWSPIVKDWSIVRQPPEPSDFWSQSFTWGDAPVRAGGGSTATPVRVRFSNDGGKPFRTAEVHLAYRVADPTPTRVTFCWADAAGTSHTAEHTYAASSGAAPAGDATWHVAADAAPRTLWVELASE